MPLSMTDDMFPMFPIVPAPLLVPLEYLHKQQREGGLDQTYKSQITYAALFFSTVVPHSQPRSVKADWPTHLMLQRETANKYPKIFQENNKNG